VYCNKVGEHFICEVLSVDDMLLARNNMEVIKNMKSQLSSKFDMKYIDAMSIILGMEINRDREKLKIRLNQRKYVETLLQRFNMEECKSINVPIFVGKNLFAE